MQIFKYVKSVGGVALSLTMLGVPVVVAQDSGQAFERGFQNAPDNAKPRVWWHWMNGDITKDGLKYFSSWGIYTYVL